MKKSVALGGIAIVALGIVAAHSAGIGTLLSATHPTTQAPAVAASRAMSPLQLMRRDRDTLPEDDVAAAF